eukprot:TRINITY_DN15199_c0_g1_i2.p1 TRINITY_DN15199_c0_g1~~TRINITY_DN15199_c0_g1_i2.p1  ORF type:complete len:365 (+),score=83.87 TRINITY_DN15199_c0_g1_i2:85-1179(+)
MRAAVLLAAAGCAARPLGKALDPLVELAAPQACACANASLCKPVSTPLPAAEKLAFTTSTNWPHFDWTQVTTVAVFGKVDPQLICTAHSHGARVVVGADMDKAQLGNETARSAWVGSLLAQAQASGLDGVNVDIEGNSANRDGLTALISELSTRFKKQNPAAQISFDLGASPLGQRAGYDHKALSQHLDFILPMLYDECWGTKEARANSPISSTGSCADQYASLGVDPGKLVLGYPWYGWDFPCDDSAAGSSCRITPPSGKPWYGYATQISAHQANITAQGGSAHVDASSETAWTEYTDAAGKRHQRWWDTPQTLSAKYRAAAAKKVRGVAFWTADEVCYSNCGGKYPSGEAADYWAALHAFSP